LKISLLPARDLDRALVESWSSLQRRFAAFANPYFSPHYTRAVAAVRSDVFVGLIEDGGSPIGFFPFQRSLSGVGRPAGGPYSGYQGVVAAPEAQWSLAELMRACRLGALEFSHMLAQHEQFAPYHRVRTQSPVMDLSGGWDAYEAKLRGRGGSQLKRSYRMMRKLNKEHGAYRYVRHVASLETLHELVRWKSEQCRQKRSYDIFSRKWCAALLERVHATQLPDFGGVLSALYVGERMIAAEIALRSPAVWHRWICAYDPAFASYSPGVMLGIEMAKAASAEGVLQLDMGKDMTFYKESFMTAAVPIAEGAVEVPSLVSAVRKARRDLESWVRRTPFVHVARIPGRWLTRFEHRARFR